MKNNNLTIDQNKITSATIKESLNHDVNSKEGLTKFIVDYKNNDKDWLIKITDLKKSFNHKKHLVLNNINLTLYKGENVALLGGNGAGKTTLIEIVAGLNKYDSGKIEYNLNHKNNFQEKIGIQFQDSSYPNGISVKRVIKFVKDIYETKINDDELNALINIFGINEFYNKRASSLSGGQSQRLNCLLAILHRPSFLILDELSTGLDVTIRNKIKSFIKSYAKEHNMNILIISHDMEEVEYLADKVVLFLRGEIWVYASVADIKKKFGSLQKMIDLYI